MVSQPVRTRASFAVTVCAGAVLLAALTGCAGKFGNAPAAMPEDTSAAAPTSTPTATPTPSPTATATDAPAPAPAPGPAPGDTAGAKALAVQACETVADGFSAARVAAAAPLAAQAASADALWQPLAAELEFIRTHPIDPNTGVGPQQTIDDSAAAAHNCFTLAGVTVSQD